MLVSGVENSKGQTSNSEVVGLALKLARSSTDKFHDVILDNIKDEPMLELLRNSTRSEEKQEDRRKEN
jgi:hypothetical protein